MDVTHSCAMPAAPDLLWALTIDIETWPSITPATITSVQLLDSGPVAVGSRARVKQPGQRAKIWTVERCQAPTEFVWSSRSRTLSMTATHCIEPTGDGATCTNHLQLHLSGPLAGVVGVLARRRLRHALATENDGFRTRLAASPAHGAVS
jgi:hypothetical protein